MHDWLDTMMIALVRAAVLVLLCGLVWRIARWLRTPVPRQVVLTPAPRSRLGVWWLMAHESVLFTTLFKASRWTWLFGWLFHLGLALVLLQHLRYLSREWWPWVNWLSAYGHVASAMMIVGLLGLLARRLVVERIRYISRVSDYAVLVLLLVVALSGAGLKYGWPANIVAVKEFVRTALFFEGSAVFPDGGGLLVHVLPALLLIGIFAWGKLMHGPALWVNPTRAQHDNRRR